MLPHLTTSLPHHTAGPVQNCGHLSVTNLTLDSLDISSPVHYTGVTTQIAATVAVNTNQMFYLEHQDCESSTVVINPARIYDTTANLLATAIEFATDPQTFDDPPTDEEQENRLAELEAAAKDYAASLGYPPSK